MKKLLTIFFIFTWMLCACSKPNNELRLTITKGILSAGVEIGYPPMEYYDNDGITPAGFDIELTKALAEKLGLQIKFIDTAWEGILAGLDAGRYDIALNITILPGRQENYNFTKSYIESSITIIALKNRAFKIEKPEHIADKRAAYQGNTTAQYFAEKLLAQGLEFSSFSYDKIKNCFDDLSLKRLDLIIVDNIAAYEYTGRENSIFEIVWQGPSDEHIGIALKKGNDALTMALNEALDELFEDGAIQEISMRIFNRNMY